MKHKLISVESSLNDIVRSRHTHTFPDPLGMLKIIKIFLIMQSLFEILVTSYGYYDLTDECNQKLFPLTKEFFSYEQ